jgi:sugar O-acyltransferase (sialic acid O-acetyltransferase NeuD family)
MTEKFVVYGAGGMGKEADWIADGNKAKLELVYFVDDNTQIINCNKKPVYHALNDELPLVISIAEPSIKRNLVKRFPGNQTFINLVSNSVKKHNSAQFGIGCIVGFDVVISCEVKIGNHTLINARSIIGHDSILGDFVSIMYNVSISGNVSIGDGTLIGSGAVVLPGIKIGKNCKIGAGAVVTKDVPDYSVVVGVPGKIIKQINIHE